MSLISERDDTRHINLLMDIKRRLTLLKCQTPVGILNRIECFRSVRTYTSQTARGKILAGTLSLFC